MTVTTAPVTNPKTNNIIILYNTSHRGITLVTNPLHHVQPLH